VESKSLDNKISTLIILTVAISIFVLCFIFIYLGRIFLFGPSEKKLPITENINPGASFRLMNVYQGNKDVDYADEIIIEGTRSYILDQSLASIDIETSIDILDISSPASPKIENIYNLPKDVYVRNMKAQGDYLYLDIGDFKVLDVADAQKPTVIWEFMPNELIRSIDISGDYLYIVDVRNLYIVDISNPQTIKLAKTFNNFNNLDYIENATVSENLLFVAGKGLYIFDISNPTKPVQISFYGLPLGVDSFGQIDISSGKTAWVGGTYIDGFGDPQGHTLLLDISDPYKPTLISTYDHYPFAIFNNLICFYDSSTSGESFHLMDFSNPYRPVELGYISGAYSSLGYPDAIIKTNDSVYIYAANYGDGLNIIKYLFP
jgi:hypothetical protein